MTYSKFTLLKKIRSEKLSLENFKSEINFAKFQKPYIRKSNLRSILDFYNISSERNELKELIKKVEFARKGGYPIFFSLSPRILSNGLSPLIINLMQSGWVSAISINDEFLIKDFEIALAGKFIDYKKNFMDGEKITGIAEETGLFLNIAFKEGDKKGKGAGEAVGDYLNSAKFKFNEHSIIANAYKLNIPVTLHSLPGSSKLHYHPNYDGRIFGNLLDRDFILFSSIIAGICGNGVFISTSIDRKEMDILINSLEFCLENGIVLNNMSIGLTGKIEESSVNKDMEKMKSYKNISIYRILGEPELLLPIISSLLLDKR